MGHLLVTICSRKASTDSCPRSPAQTNLLAFVEKITSIVNTEEVIDVVFLRFSNAFDKVPQEKLKVKLDAHGVSSKVYRWLTTGCQRGNSKSYCVARQR
jgi:hypothetical protein